MRHNTRVWILSCIMHYACLNSCIPLSLVLYVIYSVTIVIYLYIHCRTLYNSMSTCGKICYPCIQITIFECAAFDMIHCNLYHENTQSLDTQCHKNISILVGVRWQTLIPVETGSILVGAAYQSTAMVLYCGMAE